MDLEAVIDNDVLIKASCYNLLARVSDAFGIPNKIGILGAARFVVSHRIAKNTELQDPIRAISAWNTFLESGIEELEPTDDDIELATSFEEIATYVGVQLDGGESQLCAIAIRRAVPGVVTGDKRAIVGIQSLLDELADLAYLAGRVACLEQLIRAIIDMVGSAEIRARVCAEPRADRAISICFSCAAGDDVPFDPDGLRSYIRDLRTLAPAILAPGDRFPNS